MRRLLLLPLLVLAVSACAPAPSRPECPRAAEAEVYFDVLDFQRGLNAAAERPGGAWEAATQPLFRRLDARAGELEAQAAAAQPECRQELAAQLARLRTTRARGIEFVAQVRHHLAERTHKARQLESLKGAEVRLGDLRARLRRIEDDGREFVLRVSNPSRKATYRLVTERVIEGTPRPAHFVLADDLGTVYPLVEVNPAVGEKTALALRPGASAELRLRFQGPYLAQARRLTLLIDPALVVNARAQAPLALVLPRELVPDQPRPVFVAEPPRFVD